MDIGLALTYVTRDPDWIKKVLIGGLVLLASILFAVILVGFLGFLIFFGYGIRTIRNVMDGVEHPLPEWDDFGGDLSLGFKAAVGAIVWGIPIWLLSGCVAIVGTTDNDAAGLIISLFQICVITPLSILLSVFIYPTIIGRFAETNEIGPMLQVGDVIADIRNAGIAPYLLYFVLTLIASFLGALGFIVCVVGVVFTLAYAQFATFHGIAQVRQQIRAATGGPPPAEHPAF